MNKASYMFKRQIKKDVEQHIRRAIWLSCKSPKFADGSKVEPSSRTKWFEQSIRCIENPATCHNCADRED